MNKELKLSDVVLDEMVDQMSVEDFREQVKMGVFTSDDGDGYWATKDKESNFSVYEIPRPRWATHVNWYNK